MKMCIGVKSNFILVSHHFGVKNRMIHWRCCKRATNQFILNILSIEDGTVLKSSSHLLQPNKKVDFIESKRTRISRYLTYIYICVCFMFLIELLFMKGVKTLS